MKKDCSNCARERFSIPCYDCIIGNNNVPSRWVEGENYVADTVALRALQMIERRAEKEGVCVSYLLRRIGAGRELLYRWRHNKNDISAYYLQQMALDGYDINYILTGRTIGGDIHELEKRSH